MEDVLSNLKILYVEDDVIARENIKLLLNEYFINFSFAENGEDGLLKFKNFKPDIVITDIKMPKMDGLEMAKEIKKISKTPIIVTTSFEDKKYLFEAIEIGIDAYIQKPIKIDKLLDSIYKQAKNIYLDKMNDVISFKESIFQAKTELLREISHHWRQPLTVIMLVLSEIELLECNSFSSCEELLDYSKSIIKDPIKLIQTLSNDLTKFSNLFLEDENSTKLNLKREVDEVLNFFEFSFKEAKILVQINIDDIDFITYKNAFNQVIFNILLNSKEFLIKNTTIDRLIEINAKKDKNYIVIEISDNAKGIEEKFLNRVFDPYFSTKEIQNYKGIGLFMSKVLIQNSLKGDVFVENIRDGVKFTIKLPIIVEN